MRKIADLHCDTLIRDVLASLSGEPMDSPECHIALSKIGEGDRRLQLYAIYILDHLRGQPAGEFFDKYLHIFREQTKKFESRVAAVTSASEAEAAWAVGKTAAMLSVEGGAALMGDLGRVSALYEAGVRMMTLTWNGKNELASGWDTEEGFSDFGRAAVKEMERLGMIVDVSHLNDRGFDELLDIAEKPFAASHSYGRAVCGHRRNLTDGEIKEIVRRGGLIGLNFSCSFLNDDRDKASLEDIYRHADHILNLGGEHVLALGSDYDGTDVPPELDSCEKEYEIAAFLLKKGFSQYIVEKLMYENALEFFRRNLK